MRTYIGSIIMAGLLAILFAVNSFAEDRDEKVKSVFDSVDSILYGKKPAAGAASTQNQQPGQIKRQNAKSKPDNSQDIVDSVPVGGENSMRGISGERRERFVRIPVPIANNSDDGAKIRSIAAEGAYFLKISCPKDCADLDRLAADVAEKTGGKVVDSGAMDQLKRSMVETSITREASIELQENNGQRFAFMAAIDLFCVGTSLFKLNICKDSGDLAVKVAGAIGGVVTKVYNAVFGSSDSQPPKKEEAPAPQIESKPES
jgi:hypothetical protein